MNTVGFSPFSAFRVAQRRLSKPSAAPLARSCKVWVALPAKTSMVGWCVSTGVYTGWRLPKDAITGVGVGDMIGAATAG